MRESPIRLKVQKNKTNGRFYIMLVEDLPYGLYEIDIPQDQPLRITKAIFNPPATIVLWSDGTKTVVKCDDKENYDSEKGLAMAIVKKTFGNRGNYYNIFKAVLPETTDIPEQEKPIDMDFNLDFSGFADIFKNVFSEILTQRPKGEFKK
ncbi:MAG: hypothetical protein IJ523_07275 [Succinivibrionaceae bacterium]|nr:hypothetical protein [Succinivibrionaceae bacterium]